MMLLEQLGKLNEGEDVATYTLSNVEDKPPVTGEYRYLVPLIPVPGQDPVAMLPLRPQRIMFDGTKWVLA